MIWAYCTFGDKLKQTQAGQVWSYESPLIQKDIALDTNVLHVMDIFCTDRSISACLSSCGSTDLNIEQIIVWLVKHLVEKLDIFRQHRINMFLMGIHIRALDVKICSLCTGG